MVTDAALAAVAKLIAGEMADALQITYVAVGTDDTPPTASDTKLGAELFRKPYTTQSRSTAVVDTILYLAPSEAVGHIKEVGWFAGDATAAADSGLLVARTLYDHDKTALESIQIDATDTIGSAQ